MPTKTSRRDLLALAACALVSPELRAQPRTDLPRFGRFTTPPTSGRRVQIELHLHEPGLTPIKCRLEPAVLHASPACTVLKPGYFLIHAPMPTSWDDHDALIKLAHEVLHTVGAEH